MAAVVILCRTCEREQKYRSNFDRLWATSAGRGDSSMTNFMAHVDYQPNKVYDFKF